MVRVGLDPPRGQNTRSSSQVRVRGDVPLWGPWLSHLVKVSDDLVQEAQALHTHVVAVQLDVEVVEVGDGGKHDAHLRVGLVVQVLGAEVRSAAAPGGRCRQGRGAAGEDAWALSCPGSPGSFGVKPVRLSPGPRAFRIKKADQASLYLSWRV